MQGAAAVPKRPPTHGPPPLRNVPYAGVSLLNRPPMQGAVRAADWGVGRAKLSILLER